MVFNMFRAEWLKIAGNRWTTAFFIWIFPMSAFAIMAFWILVLIGAHEAREAFEPITWDEALLTPWTLVNNEFGRWIVAAFTAFVFAGEYVHGTWKNLVPRQSRIVLILTKFVTVGVFVLFAWTLMTVIVGFGLGIASDIVGTSFGEFNGEIFNEFIGDFSLQVFITLTATLIAASYAALAAMFTRNTLASVFIAILLNIAETAILLPLILLRLWLEIDLVALYSYTPGYNLANISTWITQDVGISQEARDAEGQVIWAYGPHSLEESLLIIAVIVIALVGFTVLRFQRQDITT
jgi:ABC-2 type transport system permease protein